MNYKSSLLTTLCVMLLSPLVQAETRHDCSRDAIEQANRQYLRLTSTLIKQFSQQNNTKAVDALVQIKPSEEFSERYAKEINQLKNQHYQPSQTFCDAVYNNLDELNREIAHIVEKYSK